MYLYSPPVDQTQKPCHQDTLRRFTMALASLSDADQNLYYLRHHPELPVKELAARYGLTTRAVSRRLRRITSQMVCMIM